MPGEAGRRCAGAALSGMTAQRYDIRGDRTRVGARTRARRQTAQQDRDGPGDAVL